MATFPKDVSVDLSHAIDELETAIAEIESRLESAHAERDDAMARRLELDLENARLRRELSLARERQSAGADILSSIASTPTDADQSLQRIAETTARLFGAPSVTIRLAEGGKSINFGASSHRIRDAIPAEQRRLDGDNLPGTVYRENRQIHIPDLDNVDPAMAHWPVMAARAEGTRTVAGTPLRRQGNPIGALLVYRDGLAPFTDEELALQQSFADQAVIAIENARMFNETREALERQTATAEILKVIAGSRSDVQPVFDAIAQRSNRLIEGLSTTVYSIVDGMQYLMAFTRSSPDADAALQATFPKPLSATWGDRIRNGEIVQIADFEATAEWAAQPALREMVRLRGFRGLLIVPLRRDGATIGTINVSRKKPGTFTDHHVQLLRTFAGQAVIAIENTRLFNETQEALERQTATADILKVIAGSPSNVQPVFDAIVNSAAKLFQPCAATITTLKDGRLHWNAVAELVPSFDHKAAEASYPIPFDPNRSPSARAVLERRIIEIPDTEAPDTPEITRKIAADSGFRSITFVPLVLEDKGIGTIILTHPMVGFRHPDKQLALIQTFADQAVIAIENARLFNETQQALARQTATSDILRVISQSPTDVQPVFDAVVQTAVRLFGCDTAFILRCDGTHFWSVARCRREGMVPIIDPRRAPIDPGANFPSRAIVDRKTLRLPDWSEIELPEFERRIQESLGYNSAVYLPLLREGECIGVLGIAGSRPRMFGEIEITLAESFRDQAVIAIENARLFDEVQAKTSDLTEALTYQTGSSNILRVIASSPTDVKPVLTAIVESACELCEADDALATLRDGDELVFQVQHGSIPVVWQRQPIDREGAAGLAVIDRTPVHVHDLLAAEGEQFPRAREFARKTNVRTVLCVPLLREGESIGVIVLRRTEVRPFSDKQIALLQTFADQAVIAIGNVRLFEEVQARTHDLSESLQQQTATADVLKVISASPGELKPVFQAMLENAVRLCEAKFAMLFLYQKQENEFRAVGRWNLPPAWSEFLENNRLRSDPMIPLGRVAMTKQPVQVADVLLDQSYIEHYPGMVGVAELGGARTLLQVPMLRENEFVGTIGIYRQEVRPFTDKQIALVRNFAAQAVIAIENARLLNELRQRTNDLTASLNDLRTAQDRLVQTEKLASLGQLTAGIAHEIKNPLNFVNNFAALSAELTDELNDVLKLATLGEKARDEVNELTGLLKDNLEKVVQHGKRADSIVKNMLLHSREGTGEHRSADINALVDESLNLAYHGARAEKPDFNVTLQRNFDPGAGMVEVFPQELTRVFLNLVSNGFYAVTKRKARAADSGFDPVLSATTRNLGDAVEIRIRDNGAGIPPEVRDKMFNPFFTTKPAGEGTGLGLSMSHDIIVKQHGGTIDVDTEPGQFTEFRIVLPRTGNSPNKNGG